MFHRPNSSNSCARGHCGLVVLLAAALIAIPRPAAAQSGEGSSGPSISLGEISGPPGASLMIPLYYTADAQRPLRSLTLEIDFVSNNLKFLRAARGLAAEAADAQITTDLTEGEPNAEGLKRSRVKVTAAAPQGKTLEEGMLAYLLYEISLDARPFAINLNTKILAAEGPNAPQDVASIKADPGLVVVEVLDVMPEATCFFFTH